MKNKIVFDRKWEMPNSNTFTIKCISELIRKYNSPVPRSGPKFISIDPFANTNRIAKITNDIDPKVKADYNMDALDFLKSFDKNSVDLILFDPPYSPRQVSEVYRKLGKSVNMQTTQLSFWSKLKIEIARIMKVGGWSICFGWNSNGVGKTRGFEIKEILLVAHGTNHNDTICTVEQKIKMYGDKKIKIW